MLQIKVNKYLIDILSLLFKDKEEDIFHRDKEIPNQEHLRAYEVYQKVIAINKIIMIKIVN